jgi:hypothetical protein
MFAMNDRPDWWPDFSDLTRGDLERAMEGVAAIPWGQRPPTARPRRQRRIDRAIAEAERAGKVVTSVTTPDGITLTFGAADAPAVANPFELEARRLRRQRGTA